MSYEIYFENNINVRTYPLCDTSLLLNTNITIKKTEFQGKTINMLNDLLHQSGGLVALRTLSQHMA